MPTTPDDIFEAIDKTIRLIETLISALDAMCREFEIHEIACKRAKTVGTTMNVLGAGVAIGIAFFTCGASLFPYALGGAIGGAAGNFLVDVDDNYKTRDCIRRINSLLDDFRSEMEKLQSLVEQFNKELENSMKTHNIGWQGATLHHFGCPRNTNFNLLSFMGNMRVSIPSIKIDSLHVKLIAGVGAYYMMFMMKSFAVGKLGPAAGLSIGLPAAFATGSKAGMMAGAVAGKVLAGAGVVFAAYEIVCLIRTLINDHPTLDSIREAKSQLQNEKTSLSEILSEFKKIKNAAEETVLQALTKFMQECLGGGHKTVNRRLESLTFEEFVNQIGDGREGGAFQLAFIAEMFGQSIEIFDRTADGVIGRQHGNSHMKIDPFQRLITRVPLKIELSGDSDQHHYRPLDSKGNPIDVAKSSRYPNRCLFDAIAHLKGISSNELINQLKAFLLTNPVAREVYNLNLENLFPEFRGGARPPRPINVNTLKVTRSARQSFSGPNGERWSREVVTATVRFDNLNQGATHIDRIGAEIRARGVQKLDHCGHIIARELGGPGHDINNFTPMNAKLNQVFYRCFEISVKRKLQSNPTWSARFNVALIFDPSSAFPNRPFIVGANAEFYDQNGTHLSDEGVGCEFCNPDMKI